MHLPVAHLESTCIYFNPGGKEKIGTPVLRSQSALGRSVADHKAELPQSQSQGNERCDCDQVESEEDVFRTGDLPVPVRAYLRQRMPRPEGKHRVVLPALVLNLPDQRHSILRALHENTEEHAEQIAIQGMR